MPSVFRRVFAVLIDFLVFVMLASMIEAVMQLAFDANGGQEVGSDYRGFLILVFFLLVRALFLYLYSTTPGLSLYGLRVVNSQDLGPPSLRSLLLRALFQCTIVLVFTSWFYRHRMTVYDMVCNVAYVPEYLSVLNNEERRHLNL